MRYEKLLEDKFFLFERYLFERRNYKLDNKKTEIFHFIKWVKLRVK